MSALFSPIRLAGLQLSNRIVVSPMCQYSADDGCANEWHLVHLGMLANSGASLLVVEATHVERHGRITHGCLGLYSDACEAALGRVIDHCRRAGSARLGIQLAHSGRKGSAQRPWEAARNQGRRTRGMIAPSSHPIRRRQLQIRGRRTKRTWRPNCASLRRRGQALPCALASCLIELHLAHGYLLHSFMSPVSNRRTDGFGGSLDSRLRFPLDVVRAVRAVVPKGTPLGARMTGSDWREGGITPKDAVVCAKALKTAGLDYVCVSSGGVTADTRNPTELGYNAPLAEKVRREAGIATRTVGLIVKPDQAEAMIAEGKTDMVALARAMLDDPHWGWHAAQALGAEVPRPPQYQRAGPKLWVVPIKNLIQRR